MAILGFIINKEDFIMFSNKIIFVLAFLFTCSFCFANEPGDGTIDNTPICVDVVWSETNQDYEGQYATGFSGGDEDAVHFVCTSQVSTYVTGLYCPLGQWNWSSYNTFTTDASGNEGFTVEVITEVEDITYAFTMEVWCDYDDDGDFDKDVDKICDVEAFCSTT